jgi:fructokinase
MYITQCNEENAIMQDEPVLAPWTAEPVERRTLLFGELLVDAFPDARVPGGAPFNVARHLRAFGLQPLLLSRVGEDAEGEELLQAMRRFGMDASGVQRDAEHPSGRVLIRMEDGRHEFEIVAGQAYDCIDAEPARRAALAYRPGLIYFGTLAQRAPSSKEALRALLRESTGMRMADINLRTPWFNLKILRDTLEVCDILKLNAHEMDILAELFELPGKRPRECAKHLLDRFSLQKILLTDGPAGAWSLNADHAEAEAAGRPLTGTVDTVGAGDAFAAVSILGIALGWPDALALERADRFARAVCGIRGATPEDERFYEPFLLDWKVSSPL